MSSLRQTQQTPTPSEQINLIKSLEVGIIAARALAGEVRTHATSAELEALVTAGQSARERCLTGNLGLVFMIANRAAHRYPGDREELVQEGFLGLVRAVERFDHRHGTRFSTYAVPWIRAAVEAAILREEGLGVHTGKGRRRLRQDAMALEHELGRTASIPELAARSGRSVAWVTEMARIGPPVTLADIDPPNPADVGAPVAAGPDEPVHHWLQELPGRQRAVIVRRFGFDGNEPSTLDRTAETLGLSRGQVRRAERDALARLRNCADRAHERDADEKDGVDVLPMAA